jgi:hypothetical protein
MFITRSEFDKAINEEITKRKGEWFFDNDKIEKVWKIIQKRSSIITSDNFKYIVRDAAEDVFILDALTEVADKEDMDELWNEISTKGI